MSFLKYLSEFAGKQTLYHQDAEYVIIDEKEKKYLPGITAEEILEEKYGKKETDIPIIHPKKENKNEKETN